MKLSISRAQHARLVAGLSPVERARLDELVDVHDGEPPILIDGNRIAGRFAELVAEQTRPPRRPAILGARPTEFTVVDEWRHRARQGGKTAWLRAAAAAAEEASEEVDGGRRIELPTPPWEHVGYAEGGAQVWTAPPGTPEPPASPWLDVDDVIDDLANGDQSARLDWLSRRKPSDVLAEVQELGRQVGELPARELRVGQRARDALHAVATERTDYIPVGCDFGIPIVVDPGLPAGGWRLVDAESGRVLFEGHIGPTVYDDRPGIRRDVLY